MFHKKVSIKITIHPHQLMLKLQNIKYKRWILIISGTSTGKEPPPYMVEKYFDEMFLTYLKEKALIYTGGGGLAKKKQKKK